MRRNILILICALLLIQGIVSIVREIDTDFLKSITESTALYVGKITGFLFKITIGTAGLIILIGKSKKRVSI